MMKKHKISYILPSITMAFLFSASPIQAQTCKIKGMDLVSAYTKAKGNGYKFVRWDTAFSTSRGFYVQPAPARIGVKGIKKMPSSLLVDMFAGNLKHGWTIGDVTARGSGSIGKVFHHGGQLQLVVGGLPLGRRYNVYITALYLKHPSKSCSNIQSVLTDAFGR